MAPGARSAVALCPCQSSSSFLARVSPGDDDCERALNVPPRVARRRRARRRQMPGSADPRHANARALLGLKGGENAEEVRSRSWRSHELVLTSTCGRSARHTCAPSRRHTPTLLLATALSRTTASGVSLQLTGRSAPRCAFALLAAAPAPRQPPVALASSPAAWRAGRGGAFSLPVAGRQRRATRYAPSGGPQHARPGVLLVHVRGGVRSLRPGLLSAHEFRFVWRQAYIAGAQPGSARRRGEEKKQRRRGRCRGRSLTTLRRVLSRSCGALRACCIACMSSPCRRSRGAARAKVRKSGSSAPRTADVADCAQPSRFCGRCALVEKHALVQTGFDREGAAAGAPALRVRRKVRAGTVAAFKAAWTAHALHPGAVLTQARNARRRTRRRALFRARPLATRRLRVEHAFDGRALAAGAERSSARRVGLICANAAQRA